MSSIADHYAERAESHRREFWWDYMAARSMAEPEDKIRRMCAAYRRHEADFGLPAVTDDVLRDVMRIALAGLDGREPPTRFRVRHF